MVINWQDVFYFTASLAMIAVFIICIWLAWLFFIVSKLIKNLTVAAQRLGNISDDLRYFRKDIMLKISRFLSVILDKRSKKI